MQRVEEQRERGQERRASFENIPVEFIAKVFAGCPRIRTKSADLTRRQ